MRCEADLSAHQNRTCGFARSVVALRREVAVEKPALALVAIGGRRSAERRRGFPRLEFLPLFGFALRACHTGSLPRLCLFFGILRAAHKLGFVRPRPAVLAFVQFEFVVP
jgi:hypothetical protein